MNLLSDLQSHIFSYLDSTPTSTACVQLTIAWSALYLVSVVVLPHQSKDFCNRVISIIHALLALYLTALAVDWSSPYSGLGEKTTPAEVRDSAVFSLHSLSAPHTTSYNSRLFMYMYRSGRF